MDPDWLQAMKGEESNMVLVPCWDERDASDSCLALLVDALLGCLGELGPEGDVRMHTAQISALASRQV